MANDKDWIDILAALLTPTIALFALYLGFQNFRLARRRRQDELFDKRYTTKRTAPDALFSDVQSVKEREMQKLLAMKFSHWRYEGEVRCFVSLNNMDASSGHYFFDFSTELKLKQVLVGAEANIARDDIEKSLGKDNAHVERFKTRAAFKTFHVVRNRDQSLWV